MTKRKIIKALNEIANITQENMLKCREKAEKGSSFFNGRAQEAQMILMLILCNFDGVVKLKPKKEEKYE